ncbi:SDR family oxidoreductase [Sphingobium aquiterrae]|uniref:SDR family NAD(P)-dependent oxidoreductase n=1 Tax=Sphingobium aquiterrae TaxID=2038656 RepID=UPI0030167C2D
MSDREGEPAPPARSAGTLKGAVALVTGSGRGLGHRIAETLIGLGADVAIHDIDENAPAQFGEGQSLTAVAAALASGGARTIGVTGDVTDEAAVNRIVAEVEARLGAISILINCAGGDIGAHGTKPKPNDALNISLGDAMAVFQRNFISTMLVCRAVAPGMGRRNKGAIVNFGSLNGHQAVSPEVIYGCAKAAIVHYTRCLALEMRPLGVRVNAISPGPAKTARFLATRPTDPRMMLEGPSLDRYATPSEIADVVAFLASDQSGFISGQVLRVDGGIGLYAA